MVNIDRPVPPAALQPEQPNSVRDSLQKALPGQTHIPTPEAEPEATNSGKQICRVRWFKTLEPFRIEANSLSGDPDGVVRMNGLQRLGAIPLSGTPMSTNSNEESCSVSRPIYLAKPRGGSR
jgi:hypothetical protein